MLDYGRSNLDRRNNFQLTGSVIAPAGIRFAPFITVRSGAPYDVTSGTDIFGDNGVVRADFANCGVRERECAVYAVRKLPGGDHRGESGQHDSAEFPHHAGPVLGEHARLPRVRFRI